MRAVLLLTLFAVGCGRADVAREYARKSSAVPAAEAPALGLAQSSSGGKPAENAEPALAALERKIIYTANVDLVVEDFTPAAAQVDALVKRFNGFIANSKVAGAAGESRSGEWTLRIPVANFDAFLQAAQGSLGEVRSVARDSRDVSEEFYDVEARIRNKRQEETRLLKLLEEKTGTLEDVLGIERELSRVREEIERHEGRMRVLADLTSLTTVTLAIEEVRHYVPEQATTFRDRVSRAFHESLWSMRQAGENFVVGLVGTAPWLAIVVIPVMICVRAWRKRRRGVGTV